MQSTSNYRISFLRSRRSYYLITFIYLFIYLFAIQVHYHIWWEQGTRSYLRFTCRSLPPWAGVQPPELMGPICSELWAPFPTVELHLFSVRCPRRLLFPVYFCKSSLYFTVNFVTLENYEPSWGVEPGSSHSVVGSSCTALAGPGHLSYNLIAYQNHPLLKL
jgi:hypothetical protein